MRRGIRPGERRDHLADDGSLLSNGIAQLLRQSPAGQCGLGCCHGGGIAQRRREQQPSEPFLRPAAHPGERGQCLAEVPAPVAGHQLLLPGHPQTLRGRLSEPSGGRAGYHRCPRLFLGRRVRPHRQARRAVYRAAGVVKLRQRVNVGLAGPPASGQGEQGPARSSASTASPSATWFPSSQAVSRSSWSPRCALAANAAASVRWIGLPGVARTAAASVLSAICSRSPAQRSAGA